MKKAEKITTAEGASLPQKSFDDVPDEIFDTVVSAILDRALDPGTKLPEDVFCTHYGVSRTIVRIAIQRLQQDHLVELQRNKGCFIVTPDRKEARDILSARKAIEPFLIRQIVAQASDADLAALSAHVDAEDDAYHRNDRRQALRLSGQFHILLSSFADNAVLEGYVLNLICRSALVIATYSDVTGCCKAHDHRKLVEMLAARDAEGAIALMQKHLDDIEADLLQDNAPEEAPTLESVLAKYAPGEGTLKPKRK
ncbi:GntR family transcriptional regulator [Arenibacterium sp. LLYu02]|uniref:GntR family transcriptional regulator n=1 Tax=Arenibacterium sp. LLYu02 TaxID=3404132 RepID=UPI003B21DAC1